MELVFDEAFHLKIFSPLTRGAESITVTLMKFFDARYGREVD